MIARQGNFDLELNVLRKNARIGQLFSVSKYVCDLTPAEIKTDLHDIERGEYNFTDGIGTISIELALDVARKFS